MALNALCIARKILSSKKTSMALITAPATFGHSE
jgi:hypothetical protein